MDDTHITAVPPDLTLEELRAALAFETDQRRWAECTARIQSDAVQLALDLLVREPDITGFFRAFIKTLVDESESHACGVWLLDQDGACCDLWMAYIQDRFFMKQIHGWDESLTLPVESVATHLAADKDGWTKTAEYTGDDERLPAAVREFNRSAGIRSVLIAPLLLPTRNLGWVALSTGPTSACEGIWRRTLL